MSRTLIKNLEPSDETPRLTHLILTVHNTYVVIEITSLMSDGEAAALLNGFVYHA